MEYRKQTSKSSPQVVVMEHFPLAINQSSGMGQKSCIFLTNNTKQAFCHPVDRYHLAESIPMAAPTALALILSTAHLGLHDVIQ